MHAFFAIISGLILLALLVIAARLRTIGESVAIVAELLPRVITEVHMGVQEVDDLIATANNTDGVIASAIVAIQTFTANQANLLNAGEIDAAKAANAALAAKAQDLATAIANVPAAPAPAATPDNGGAPPTP